MLILFLLSSHFILNNSIVLKFNLAHFFYSLSKFIHFVNYKKKLSMFSIVY